MEREPGEEEICERTKITECGAKIRKQEKGADSGSHCTGSGWRIWCTWAEPAQGEKGHGGTDEPGGNDDCDKAESGGFYQRDRNH